MSHEVMDGGAEADDLDQPQAAAGGDAHPTSSGPDRRPRRRSRGVLVATGALLLAVLAAAAGSSLGESRARVALAADLAGQQRVAVYTRVYDAQPDPNHVLVELRFALLGSRPVVVTGLDVRLATVRLTHPVELPPGVMVFAGFATVTPDCSLTSYVDPALTSGATVTVRGEGTGTPPSRLPVVFAEGPDELASTLMSPCAGIGVQPRVDVTGMTAHRDGTLEVRLRNASTVPVTFDLGPPMAGMTVASLTGRPLPLVLQPTGREVVLRLRFTVGSCADVSGAGLIPDSALLYPRSEGELAGWDPAEVAAAAAAAVTLACR